MNSFSAFHKLSIEAVFIYIFYILSDVINPY